MADRYWVGGSGTWDSSSTANWSTTSGGAAGASAPHIVRWFLRTFGYGGITQLFHASR